MKTSFFLFAVFFLICLVGTAAGAFIYMLYMNCSLLVTGEPLSFFSSYYFLVGLHELFPIMTVASILFMIFYLIRHKSNIIASISIYSFLCALIWLVLIPLNFSNADKRFISVEKPAVKTVTAGYFRKVNKGIYYFSTVDTQGFADGLYIDTENLYGLSNGVQSVNGMPSSMVTGGGFADPLILESIKLNTGVKYIFGVFNRIVEFAKKAFSNGFSSWLGFAFMGLSISSLIGLKRCSKWRLLNVMLIMGVFSAIICLNTLIYTEPFFVNIRKLLIPFVSSPDAFTSYGGFLGWSGFIPLVLNGLIFIVFTFIGFLGLHQSSLDTQDNSQ